MIYHVSLIWMDAMVFVCWVGGCALTQIHWICLHVCVRYFVNVCYFSVKPLMYWADNKQTNYQRMLSCLPTDIGKILLLIRVIKCKAKWKNFFDNWFMHAFYFISLSIYFFYLCTFRRMCLIFKMLFIYYLVCFIYHFRNYKHYSLCLS